MKDPTISVIVPVYKVEPYIHQCVDSILGQTYQNLEIILVDDGSPDNCGAICDEYAAKDARVRVLHKQNGGQSSARNMALDVMTGEYVAFVDSDDYLELTAYEQMMDFMQSGDLNVVYCVPSEIVDGEVVGTRYHYYADQTVRPASEIAERTLKNEISAEPWLKLCHKSCWEGLRFPEGRIYEDIAIAFYPLVKAKKPVGFLDRPLYNYRINRAGTTQRRKPITRYHFFLALRERYDYALSYVPAAAEAARNHAARFAMGVYLDYHCNKWQELAPYISEAEQFLCENKAQLLKSAAMPKNLKYPLRLYYASKPAFTRVYGWYLKLRKEK